MATETEMRSEGKVGVSQYCRAHKASYAAMSPFRSNYRKFVKEFVGVHYSDHGADRGVPQNWIELGVNTYLHTLVARNPRVMLSTKKKELRPAALNGAEVVNKAIERSEMEDSLRIMVQEALFAPLGVMLTGPNLETGNVTITGDSIYEVVSDPILFEDVVIDMGAKSERDITYIGHRFHVPLHAAKANKSYRSSARAKLNEAVDARYRINGEDSARQISRGTPNKEYEYEDYVTLWYTWFPDRGVVWTTAEGVDDEILQEVKWTDPDPYDMLKFIDVPGQVLGLPLVALMYDLHEAGNRLTRKLVRQGVNQKTVNIYKAGKADEAKTIYDAEDMEAVPSMNPGDYVPLKFNGPDGPTNALVLQLFQWFDRNSGNLSSLAGLGPQSETLGQDQLLAAASSIRPRFMAGRLQTVVRSILRKWTRYVMRDPFLDETVLRTVEGVPEPIEDWLRAADIPKSDSWLEINVEPYSMQDRTPTSQMNLLMMIFERLIFPLLPEIKAQGGIIKMQSALKLARQFSQFEQLDELVEFPNARNPSPVEESETARPPVTNRIHTRVNKAGSKREGFEQSMISRLMGQGQQDGAAEAIARRTG